jgi:hypothetical protein
MVISLSYLQKKECIACFFKIPAEIVQNTNIATMHSKGPNSTAKCLNALTIRRPYLPGVTKFEIRYAFQK